MIAAASRLLVVGRSTANVPQLFLRGTTRSLAVGNTFGAKVSVGCTVFVCCRMTGVLPRTVVRFADTLSKGVRLCCEREAVYH